MSVSRETQLGPASSEFPPVSRETGAAQRRSPAAALLLLPLRAYRRLISPVLRPRCRYYPSCSAYAEEAIGELGAVRGAILALWRLSRCNPLSNGGLDPLESRPIFCDHEVNERTEAA